MKSANPWSFSMTPATPSGGSHNACLSMLAGPMPRRRCHLIRMDFFLDVNRSRRFLCLRIERLAWPSNQAQVLETQIFVCKAIEIERPFCERDDYLKHCIEMMGQRLLCGNKLEILESAINAMVSEWNLLGVFQALERLPLEEPID